MIKEENIPEDWKLKSLSEICYINPRKSEIKDLPDEEKVTFLSMDSVNDDGKITKKEIKSLNEVYNGYTYFKKNDVLFAKITPCMENGKGAIADIDTEIGFGSTEFHILRSNEDIIPEWIHCFLSLKSIRKIAEAKMTGSAGQKRVPNKFFDYIKIPLPPIEIQQKIVHILDNAEKLKEWRLKADELTNEYLKSLFMDMFGDPRDNSKSWDIVNFNKIAKIEKTSVNPDKMVENSNYIGLEHIESETGCILNIMTVQDAGLKSNKYVFDEECVLYGKLRPYLNKVALPNFKGVSSTDILPIKSIEGISNKYFIKFLLSHPYYIKKSTEMSTGANLPRISSKAIEKFKVYSPPLKLQNQFAEIVKNVETLKNYQKQSKVQIDNLFNNLMQNAFKGELTC